MLYQSVILAGHALWNENGGGNRKAGGKDGRGGVKNVEMGIECNKKEQDEEQVCERDGENCKAGRQTSGHKVTLV